MILAPFAPLTIANNLANSVTLAATAAAAPVTLTAPASRIGNNQLMISNTASTWAYVNLGTAALNAATVANSMPVAPGAMVVVTIDPTVTTASVILASGTGNVTFTAGEGT